YAEPGRGEPGARLARDSPEPRPARLAAHAVPGAVTGDGQPRFAHHVSNDRECCGIRSGKDAAGTRAHASSPPPPGSTEYDPRRRDGGSAVAVVRARRNPGTGGFPFGRLERPRAISVRSRPRQPACRGTV